MFDVLIGHGVPRSERDQTNERDEHANIKAEVYFEASMISAGPARFYDQADVTR